MTEIAFKTCSKEESANLTSNPRLLTVLAEYLSTVNGPRSAITAKDLTISFYPSRSMTVVHVDSHSDLYLYPAGQKAVRHIADYLNFAAEASNEKNYQIGTVIWIVPDTFPVGAAPISGMPFHLSQTTPYAADAGGVRVTTTRLSQIDFSTIPDGYLLDIDSDYFSNSGWDTRFEWGENASRQELLARLQIFADRFFSSSARRPSIVTIAASPGFTPWEDLLEITSYLKNIFTQKDLIPNTVANYRYHYQEGQDTFLKQEIAYQRSRATSCHYSQTFYDLMGVFGAEDSAAEYLGFCKSP